MRKLLQKLIGFIFFGNIFYAACTVALCIETNLVAGLPLNSFDFYLLIAAATICFYGMIYYISGNRLNRQMVAFDWYSRINWYVQHKKLIRVLLILGISVLVITALIYLLRNMGSITQLSITDYFLLVFFPFVAVAYSYEILPFKQLRILRNAGTLKPFILGFAWAGFVTVYPYIALKWEGFTGSYASLSIGWLFVQNFIFISMLCILFDIKDEPLDRKKNLKTIPVRLGIHATVYYVMIPLILLNLLIKFIYFKDETAFYQPVLIRCIPYVFLLFASLEVRKPKATLYYLAVVDGLMLVKAVFGIISVYHF